MKKFLKLFICIFTLIAGFGMAVINPTIDVVRAIEQLGAGAFANVTNSKGDFAFSSVNMPKKVDATTDEDKEGFAIPIPTVSDNTAEITIHVKVGKTHHTHVIGASDTNYFKANTENTAVYFTYNQNTSYSVYYTATTTGGKTYTSSIYEVVVSGVNYAFDATLSDNLPVRAGINDKLLLPTINVVNGAGDVKEDANVQITVLKNNTEIIPSIDGEVRVEEGETYLYPTDTVNYTVRYRSTKYNLTKEYSINVLENFDSSKVSLEAKTLTMKTVELGKVATFPKAVVTDTYHNYENVKTNTVISIYDKENQLVETLPANTYEYTFENAGSYVVKYEIENMYLNNKKTLSLQIAEDVIVSDTIAPKVSFAKDYDTSVENWEENVVTMGNYAVPTKVGYNGIVFPALYATDLGTSYGDITFKRLLKSNDGKEYDIDSVEDNASLAPEYEKDITKAVAFSFKHKENEQDEDYIARVKGSYTLVYEATEQVGKDSITRTGRSTSVVVEVLGQDASTYTDDTNLSIELPNTLTTMRTDEVKTLSVKNPKDDADKAIEARYYYYYGEKSVFETAFATYKGSADYAYNINTFLTGFNTGDKLTDLSCVDNKVEIELKDYATKGASETKFTILAIAINDQGQFVYDAKEVKIKNATTDAAAPTLSSATGFDKIEYMLGEDTKVDLPEVEFVDNLDSDLSFSVQYYIDNIENGLRPINGGSYAYETGNVLNINGGYINPTQAGMYYVVYTIKDDSNNIYDFVTSFEVKKKVNHYINVDFDSVVDMYGSTEINAKVVDDDGNDVSATVKIDFTGMIPTIEGNTYTFNTAGDYTFSASAVVGPDTIKSATYTIKVNEGNFKWEDESNISVPKSSEISPAAEYMILTSKPADWDTNYANYYTDTLGTHVASAVEFVANTYYTQTEKVYVQITVPNAIRNGHSVPADVKVTDPNGDIVELIDVVIDGVNTGDVKFEASKEGKYTVKFSAGSGDSAINKEFYVSVGDMNPPTVKIENISSLLGDLNYTDKSITYRITKTFNSEKSTSEENVYDVTITGKYQDAESTFYSRQVELHLFDRDRTGKKVPLTWENAIKNSSIKLNGKTSESSSEYIWTISSVGKQEITIVASDTNGNESDPLKYSFKVTSNTNRATKKDSRTGIVLIVISVIVLASIICFFTFAGKPKRLKTRKTKKVEDKIEE